MSALEALVRVLRTALLAAGFRAGDRFEVASMNAGRMVAARFSDPQQAAAWLLPRGQADLYYVLNPICMDARPPNGRVRDEDIAEARALLLDVDPAELSDGARDASREIGNEIANLIKEHTGVEPPVLDSGRGTQIILRHEPAPPGDPGVRRLRKRLLELLGRRFDREGAKVDTGVANASRLARLPLGRNSKSGRAPCYLTAGSPGRASLGALRKLVEILEAEGGTDSAKEDPPTATSANPLAPDDPRLGKLRETLGSLAPDTSLYRWVGYTAKRAGVAGCAAAVVPAGLRSAFRKGVEVAEAGAKLTAPTDNRTLASRLRREVEALALPPEPFAASQGTAGVAVHRVVHHRRPRSRGGHFDLELATPASAGVIRGLTGRELLSFRVVSAMAAEVGVLLPSWPRRQGADDRMWRRVLDEPYGNRTVVLLPEAGEVEVRIEEAVAAYMETAQGGQGLADLDRGEALVLGSETFVARRALLRAVRRALDEPVPEAQVCQVISELGGRFSSERRFPDGQGVARKRSVVSFPLAAPPPPLAPSQEEA
jgi:hypothetical protein